MNKRQLVEAINQVVKDLELAEKRVSELEQENVVLKAMLPVYCTSYKNALCERMIANEDLQLLL